MTHLYCIKFNSTVMKQMSKPTQNGKKLSLLPPKCARHAFLCLLMSPSTSPNDHSPVNPASSIEFNETIEDMNDAEGINSDAIEDINDKCLLDKLLRPKFMEMDGTYNRNN